MVQTNSHRKVKELIINFSKTTRLKVPKQTEINTSGKNIRITFQMKFIPNLESRQKKYQ